MILFTNLFAQKQTVTYEFAKLQSYTENWQYAVVGLVCVLVIAFVVFMYRRDSVELKPGIGVVLLTLRLLAFGGLLLYFLDLEKRTSIETESPSRVVIVIDTSTSMNRTDTNPNSTVASGPPRIDTVVEALKRGDLLDSIRKKHEVIVYRFDSEITRLMSLPKFGTNAVSTPDPTLKSDSTKTAATAPNKTNESNSDWQTLLQSQGAESRYGQALQQVISDERAHPLSAVIVIGDFAHNFGADPEVGVQIAKELKLPVHTVAVGTPKVPVNVSIASLRVPPRGFPGDKFPINALIQGSGITSRSVNVSLYMKEADPTGKIDNKPGDLITKDTIVLEKNKEATFTYEVPGLPKPAHLIYTLQIDGVSDDSNPTDNTSQADIEIVERKTKVLLLAGGPTREYQFLRNQLRRDKNMTVDVLLQNAGEGISQDANKILDVFPRLLTELAEYDVIVGFDPDWRALDDEQIDVLDQWLAKESGGLIVLAGPVNMDEWIQNDSDRIKKIRSFYPVEFSRGVFNIDNSKFGSEIPWPIEFTSEGKEADFLWLGSTPEENSRHWTDFPGVYGFYQVRGPKPAAIVYGYYSNPDASMTSGKPIYFAEQFWGSGRVFYMGSGEMWRLRQIGDGYFEQLYTKLIRHVSQGRLLRGSKLGSILMDRDRFIQGNTIVVRAQLQDAQHQALQGKPVDLRVVHPDMSSKVVPMTADATRKGFFNGQFVGLQLGTYQLEIKHPEIDEIISKRVQVSAPQLEVDFPQRNDALAKRIADGTGGKMLLGVNELNGAPDRKIPAIADYLEDQSKKKVETGAIDQNFQENWMRGIMYGIVACLCAEWIIRRLCRLA